MVEARTIKAGFIYCLLVMAAVFVLGVVRNLCVAPLAGPFVAVGLETPILLAIAWNACGWVAERMDVSHHAIDRLAMGGLALATLLAGELVIALVADGRSAEDYLGHYAPSAILLGLVAQLAFAFIPLARRRRGG